MAKRVTVRLHASGRILDFDAGELDLTAGDQVVVESPHGGELGTVTVVRSDMEPEQVASLHPVLRRAQESDLEDATGSESKIAEARRIFMAKVAEHRLPMKLVDVARSLDGGRITFYFSSETRVDFRTLVRELASALHARIELKQVGARDQARLVGGLGPCGRPVCCAAFLTEFQPVSVRMAKKQSLALNPSKISGLCGRLMCCLRYESANYGDNGNGGQSDAEAALELEAAEEEITLDAEEKPTRASSGGGRPRRLCTGDTPGCAGCVWRT